MSNREFEGYYFKHQKAGQTISLIPGIANGAAFVQVITNETSRHFDFPETRMQFPIRVGNCAFGAGGIQIDLPGIRGEVRYTQLTQLRSDIMGPFRHFPMECRHGVISMHHRLSGAIEVEGHQIDLNDGIGYIEKDSGRSFPKEYLWIHCNDFPEVASIMVSIAHIPFSGLRFRGCICAIIHGGEEYRLATYRGVHIVHADSNRIILEQRRLRLEIDIVDHTAQPLYAPINGRMTGIVRECNCAAARFRYWMGSELIFDLTSENVSFECATLG